MDTPSHRHHTVQVWDLPTRIFHWCLVALIAAQWISAELGKLSVHMTLGTIVLVLLVFRLIWGVFGSRTSRFADFVRGPAAILAYLKASKSGHPPVVLGHNPLGAYSVLILLLLVIVQGISGLYTSDDIATDGPLVAQATSATVNLMSKLHRGGFNLLLLFVVLHVAAIAFYRLVKKDDLIRPMLTGRKQVPGSVDGVRFAPLGLALAVLAAAMAIVFGGLALFQ